MPIYQTAHYQVKASAVGKVRSAIAEFVEHYHRERNHQGLRNQLIEPLPAVRIDDNRILTRERLGDAQVHRRFGRDVPDEERRQPFLADLVHGSERQAIAGRVDGVDKRSELAARIFFRRDLDRLPGRRRERRL